MATAVSTSGGRQQVALIVAETLRVPVGRVTANVPFVRLGMDSLGAVELTTAIEDELGVTLAMTAVYEYATLDRLVGFLGRTEAGVERPVTELMRADAVLPADICATLATKQAARPVAAADARHIMVTGGTGFLGAYVVAELLKRTSAAVHCVVRCSSAADGLQRVRRQLERHGLWRPAYAARLHVVPGDLESPGLGLRGDHYATLATGVDVVYHVAAAVNWSQDYESLRAANVVGTMDVLRFACAGRLKPVHLVSSIGVCYSARGPRVLDERVDPMASAIGLHLGYAQSKCVAEALSRAAGERGLPVTIVRPALLSGNSLSGRGNPDDLVARFIAGCIRMRSAPDLDWRMDCLPVDFAAGAMVSLSLDHSHGVVISNLVNEGARHWRECVLWMRLRGYDIELIPYAAWQLRLRNEGPDHPLYPLRPFFLHGIPAEQGLTLPELYQESHRTKIICDDSRRRVVAAAGSCPELDARLLDCYFRAFIADGTVPQYPSSGHHVVREDLRELLAARLAPLGMRDLRLERLKGDASIVAELTSWRHDSDCGLYRGRATSSADGVGERTLFVKAKPTDEQVMNVGEAVASLASRALGECYRQFRGLTGFARCHERELALYGQSDERLRRHQPTPVWIEADCTNDGWVLVLEEIQHAVLMDATDPSLWDARAITAAIHGLAEMHAVWLGRERELRMQSWMGPRCDQELWVRMLPLWDALATHARMHNAAWSEPALVSAHDGVLRDISGWTSTLDRLPLTLIHNDFNPRNIAICAAPTSLGPDLRLCAFDWELATIGVPQRDLAELLCFVLPHSADRVTVIGWLEMSRCAMERSTGCAIDPTEWEAGFRAALCELLVDRLSTYAMVDRIRRQRFLPGVMRSWLNLYAHFPWTTR